MTAQTHSDSTEFEKRRYQQGFTPEFLREIVGKTGADAYEDVEHAAHRIEQDYNIVTQVVPMARRANSGGFNVDIIAARDMDRSTVQRAIRDLHHWIDPN